MKQPVEVLASIARRIMPTKEPICADDARILADLFLQLDARLRKGSPIPVEWCRRCQNFNGFDPTCTDHL